MLSALVSKFPGATAVQTMGRLSLDQFLAKIAEGEREGPVTKIRALATTYSEAVARTGQTSEESKAAKAKLDTAKAKLQCVTLAGLFRDRSTGAIPVTMSGYVGVDLDGLPDVEAAREKLKGSPHLAAVWRSCSGRGLWALSAVDPEPTAGSYSEGWAALAEHVAELLGLTLQSVNAGGRPIFDPAVKNVSRLCFVSHDPDLWQNPRPKPLSLVRTHADPEEVVENDSSARAVPAPAPAPEPVLCTSAPCTPALGSAEEIIRLMQATVRAEERLAALPAPVRETYTSHFHKRFTPTPGTRNPTLALAAPALVRRLSFDVALEVLMAFYDLYAELWNDPRTKHESESHAALTNAIASLVAGMSDGERTIYGMFSTEARRAAFRICRDLSLTNDQETPGAFYLSEVKLAERIGVAATSARECLQDFRQWRILELLELGQKREKDKTPKATRWRWLLPR